MKVNGYDPSQPIIIWNSTIIDGHTRYRAASQAGIEDVPIYAYDFENELAALQYAIHNQRNRRNLTDAEIMRCVEAVDKLRERGARPGHEFRGNQHVEFGKNINPNIFTPEPPTHQQTAEVVGISPTKVQEVRAVASDPKAREEVESGIKTIHGAAQEVREKKRELRIAEKPKFNRTNDDSIEWASWTWNPVTGCEHDCHYCYARDIAKRFYPPEIGFNPHFYPERLEAPKNTPVPQGGNPGERSVFVVSMGDLFGDWVLQEWIDKVFDAVCKAPQWNFIFLTKNPKRYLGINWPKNSWAGATADTQKRANIALEIFKEVKAGQNPPTALFLSMEPLSERIVLPKPMPCDWLIIGGQSSTSGGVAKQPNWEWVEAISEQFPSREHEVKIYYKPKCRRREFPTIKAGSLT
jgi:protein gp37